MPYPCHPVVHCPCNHAYQPETVKIKEKSRDPSSYWVTVRRITPLHVAMAATEAYQTQKSRDSTMILSSPKCRNIQTKSPHEHAKDQSSPSVPSKKLVKKNNGIQPSSTSFATISVEQVSVLRNEVNQSIQRLIRALKRIPSNFHFLLQHLRLSNNRESIIYQCQTSMQPFSTRLLILVSINK